MKESLSQPDKCPVCLDSLKQGTGTIIGTLCGHLFHQNCLFDWEENTCPVCRYESTPTESIFCEMCHQQEDLWLCLSCGKLCCGEDRPTKGHSLEHYE